MHLRSLGRVVRFAVAAALVAGWIGSGAPAYANGSSNVGQVQLCLATGFGYYGVTNHAIATVPGTGGTAVRVTGEAFAWIASTSVGNCDTTVANFACGGLVNPEMWADGNLITNDPVGFSPGSHSEVIGYNSNYGAIFYYTAINDVYAEVDNTCSSVSNGYARSLGVPA